MSLLRVILSESYGYAAEPLIPSCAPELPADHRRGHQRCEHAKYRHMKTHSGYSNHLHMSHRNSRSLGQLVEILYEILETAA